MFIKYKFLLLAVLLSGFGHFSFSQQCNVIYVTPNGASAGAAGTRANPASLTYGLSLANGVDNLIWMAAGNYPLSSPLQLVSNVTLEGGFDPVTWIKSNATPTVIQKDNTNVIPAPANALVALAGLTISNFRLQDLTITVANATTPVTSVYGVYLNGCSNYNIVRCSVTSGAATPGAAGAPGAIGAPGSPGNPGTNGTTEPGPDAGGAGGAGGNNGGNGGNVNNYNPGAAANGTVGSGPNGGTAGGGGSGTGCVLGCTLGPPGCNGNAGTAGGQGGPGTNGADGAAGLAGTVGGLGYFIPGAAGGTGIAGTAGSGGGGGGGSGGQQENGLDDWGGAGGGGGGGIWWCRRVPVVPVVADRSLFFWLMMPVVEILPIASLLPARVVQVAQVAQVAQAVVVVQVRQVVQPMAFAAVPIQLVRQVAMVVRWQWWYGWQWCRRAKH